MFIDYKQEQWPDQLAIAEFAYNNKVQTSTRVSLFKTNNKQDPYMGFEMRKKGKFKKTVEFAMRMKEVHKEMEVALRKSQECYKIVPRKETISCIFLNLVDNIQKYNTRGI